jgi:hypothetical protein
MTMGTGLAIAAIVISVLSAVFSARVSYQVAGSRFRVSENFLSDLATLLAALRSIAAKGAIVMGEQRVVPIPIDAELDAVRSFAASTSGLALALHAGAVGSAGGRDDPTARAWRVLRFHFANLSSMKVDSRSDNQTAGKLALDIERTLGTLDKDAIRSARRRIKNLPGVLSSLEHSREQDILLAGLDSVIPRERVGEDGSGHQLVDLYRRLRQLKDAGVADPDVDFWLAMERGDEGVAELRDALDRGAHVDVPLEAVVSRYARVDFDLHEIARADGSP